MFTTTTTTQIRNAAAQLTLTASASMMAVLLVASAPLQAGQNGHYRNADAPAHSNAHGNASAAPANGMASRPSHAAAPSGSMTTPSNHTMSTGGSSSYGSAKAGNSYSQAHVPTSQASYSVPNHGGQGYNNGSRAASNVPTDVNNGSFAGQISNGHGSNNGWRPQGSSSSKIVNINNSTTIVNNGGRNRGPEFPMDHGRDRRIPENHFASNFGRNHEFHVGRQLMMGGRRSFRFGGVAFGISRPWPAGWVETDALYVDYVGGNYTLCNRRLPGVQIPVDVDSCPTCGVPVAPQPLCDNCSPATMVPMNTAECTQCASDGVPTLARGQSIAEVVSILGTPVRAFNMGFKQIYLYQNMKVVFINGRMIEAI